MSEFTDKFELRRGEFAGEIPEGDLELPEGGELQAHLKRLLDEARRHFEDDREPFLKDATKYYNGEPLGTEEEGRSKVVSTDVRDSVRKVLPSLLRLYFGTSAPVEYAPERVEDEAEAQQRTDYVNYVIREDNAGFITFHSVFKDALVRRMGVAKWWWDDSVKKEGAELTGLTPSELDSLKIDDDVEIVEETKRTEQVEMDTLEGEPQMQEVEVWDVKIERIISPGRVVVEAVPSEEFWYSPNARSLEDAGIIAHVREMRASDLVAMGIDEELIRKAADSDKSLQQGNTLAEARRGDVDSSLDEEPHRALRKVRLAEVYIMLEDEEADIEEQRPAELHRILLLGEDCTIVEDEKVDEIPFAAFIPDPEAHHFGGLGIADLSMDVQLVKSAIHRGILDSLQLSLQQDIEVVKGQVEIDDVLSPELSRIIRVSKPGMIREIPHRFLGADALPVLQVWDQKLEDSTGTPRAAAGLDADALQSTTKAAVTSTMSGAQQQIEMIARIFAETGMKRLFVGVGNLISKHHDFERMIRLRNNYVRIDPKYWTSSMDVRVNIALGAGLMEERVRRLQETLAMQLQMMQLGSPLVGWAEIRATWAKIFELTGHINVDAFLKPFGPEEQKVFEQQQQQAAQQQSPEMMLVQVEQQKAQADAQIDAAKLTLEQRKMELEDDRERDKLVRDTALKQLELELKFKKDIDDAQLRAAIERDRVALDADIKAREMAAKAQQAAAQQTQES